MRFILCRSLHFSKGMVNDLSVDASCNRSSCNSLSTGKLLVCSAQSSVQVMVLDSLALFSHQAKISGKQSIKIAWALYDIEHRLTCLRFILDRLEVFIVFGAVIVRVMLSLQFHTAAAKAWAYMRLCRFNWDRRLAIR